MEVVKAYRTDHYPLDGNIPEEILVLENGQAVFLNSEMPDQICSSVEEAFSLCVGTPEESEGLVIAWADGYQIEQNNSTMNIRDLVGQDTSKLFVDGIRVRTIEKKPESYEVWLNNGECISCKGHDTIENLHRPQSPPSSEYRIRRHGEFGSTIN